MNTEIIELNIADSIWLTKKNKNKTINKGHWYTTIFTINNNFNIDKLIYWNTSIKILSIIGIYPIKY